VAPSDVPTTPALGTGDGLPARHVLLCRGVTGATDLADWWRAERAPKRSAARTVVVELTDARSAAPLLTWTFRGCRVVQLSHSPLDALVATVITEPLVFDYADVDID
jgi:phage tail-like protein